MMKSAHLDRRHRTAAAAFAAVTAVGSIVFTPMAATASSPNDSDALTGRTDVSTLDVVDWVEPEPGSPLPARHPLATGGTILTEPIGCANRKDFYRVISASGATKCFQKAGVLYLSTGITSPRYLCPGNNVGRSYYSPGLGIGPDAWTVYRDGRSNNNACYEFAAFHQKTVLGVQIK